MTTSKPKAVLISDVHYNINTLKLADASMRLAIAKANALNVPLIVAGDLHDTKASLRGECVSAMIETFKLAGIIPYVLVGNHDKINEKSEDNAIEFLQGYAHLIKVPLYSMPLDLYLVPYQHDPEALLKYLGRVPKGSQLIMHQGRTESDYGDYIQDKSALSKDAYTDFRVISGHYHTRKNYEHGGNVFSYIGNPYTLTFGEAKDPEKGFQVLYQDGSLEFIPTNLRKHIKFDISATDLNGGQVAVNADDLVFVKLSGTKEQLDNVSKDDIQQALKIPTKNFKLELTATDSQIDTKNIPKSINQADIIDSLIDSMKYSNEQKQRLKSLWKGL